MIDHHESAQDFSFCHFGSAPVTSFQSASPLAVVVCEPCRTPHAQPTYARHYTPAAMPHAAAE